MCRGAAGQLTSSLGCTCARMCTHVLCFEGGASRRHKLRGGARWPSFSFAPQTLAESCSWPGPGPGLGRGPQRSLSRSSSCSQSSSGDREPQTLRQGWRRRTPGLAGLKRCSDRGRGQVSFRGGMALQGEGLEEWGRGLCTGRNSLQGPGMFCEAGARGRMAWGPMTGRWASIWLIPR